MASHRGPGAASRGCYQSKRCVVVVVVDVIVVVVVVVFVVVVVTWTVKHKKRRRPGYYHPPGRGLFFSKITMPMDSCKPNSPLHKSQPKKKAFNENRKVEERQKKSTVKSHGVILPQLHEYSNVKHHMKSTNHANRKYTCALKSPNLSKAKRPGFVVCSQNTQIDRN